MSHALCPTKSSIHLDVFYVIVIVIAAVVVLCCWGQKQGPCP